MLTSLIVAASANHAIGKDNQLLWHLPNDMKFFKNTTWGMPVVMGRKTFESLGKPLTGRTNIVITRNKEWFCEGVQSVSSFEEALIVAADADAKEAFIIGGGEIYQQAFAQVHRIYMTRIHAVVEGDTFFPEINEREWMLLSQLDFSKDAKHAFDYSFQIWERK